MEQVVWFFNGEWRVYPDTEGTAYADEWRPLQIAPGAMP